jgi:hypothetical protein
MGERIIGKYRIMYGKAANVLDDWYGTQVGECMGGRVTGLVHRHRNMFHHPTEDLKTNKTRR